jgi:mono/diheme cytochrome c family protein
MVAATAGCEAGRHSAAGFRLPDGDIERGQSTFVSKGCNQCHRVAGVEMPAPTVQPPVPVVLGGEVTWKVTDGYLTTSIVNPTFALARYPSNQITINGKSRMPHFAESMTVRELTDIVAFLQSKYTERPMERTYAPY